MVQAHFTHNRYTKAIRGEIISAAEGTGPAVHVPKRADIRAKREAMNISQDSLVMISGASVGAITSCERGARCSPEMRVWLMRCMDECVWDERRGAYLRTVAGVTVEIYQRIRLESGHWGRPGVRYPPGKVVPHVPLPVGAGVGVADAAGG